MENTNTKMFTVTLLNLLCNVVILYRKSLIEELLKNKYSKNELNFLIEGILKCSKALETCSLVHKDIKPSNILFCQDDF